jgi:hypothetical protein
MTAQALAYIQRYRLLALVIGILLIALAFVLLKSGVGHTGAAGHNPFYYHGSALIKPFYYHG